MLGMKRGPSKNRTLIIVVGLYFFLVIFTDVFDEPQLNKDIFRLEKLPMRPGDPGDDVLVTEFNRRRKVLKEVCTAWGAYITKVKFLKKGHAKTLDPTKHDLTADRQELSQNQLERIWQLNKRSSYHQMFVDRKHSLTWCKVPKAASTSWLHAFLELAGITDVENHDMAGKHALLREKYPLLATAFLRKVMPTTMRFMVVRHPFERVLSAYRDKLEDYQRDLKDRGGYYYAIYGKNIVKTYRKTAAAAAGETDNSDEHKEPTFREFIQYLLDTDVEIYDEHWRPMNLLCTPCHIKFDIIAKMETLPTDADFILYHRGISNKVNIKWSHKTDSKKTSDVAVGYFSQLTQSEVKQLYYKYLTDFLMFEYDADPYIKLAASPAENSTLNEVAYNYDEDEENDELEENEDDDDDDDDDDDNDESEDEYEYEEDDDNTAIVKKGGNTVVEV